MDRDMMCVRDVQGIFLVFPHNVVREDRFGFWYGILYSWMRWLRFIGEYIDLGMLIEIVMGCRIGGAWFPCLF